jgi:hypothetical protein
MVSLGRLALDESAPADLRDKEHAWLDMLGKQAKDGAVIRDWRQLPDADFADSVQEEHDHILQGKLGGGAGHADTSTRTRIS